MTIKKHTNNNKSALTGRVFVTLELRQNEKWKKNKRVEGERAEARPYLHTSTCHWFKYRPLCFQICHKHAPWQYVWLAGFLITPACTNFFLVRCPCPHYSGRRHTVARLEMNHGTMPFILTEGVTLSCVRDECARLSVSDMNRDVKLTYLSGCRGRPVWEQPCCVMRVVTKSGRRWSWCAATVATTGLDIQK